MFIWHTQQPKDQDLPLNELDTKDNVSIRHSLQEERDNEIQIWCSNMNWLQFDRGGGKLSKICIYASELNTDIIALTEHNIDTNKYFVKSTMVHIFKKKLQKVKVQCSFTQFQLSNTHNQRGTMMITNGKLVLRVIE